MREKKLYTSVSRHSTSHFRDKQTVGEVKEGPKTRWLDIESSEKSDTSENVESGQATLDYRGLMKYVAWSRRGPVRPPGSSRWAGAGPSSHGVRIQGACGA